MGLHVLQISVGGFDKNFSYVIHDEDKALIVDPSGDTGNITEVIDDKQLTPVGVLVTHTHQDHIDGLAGIFAIWQVPVYVHKNGVERITSPRDPIPLDEGTELGLGEHAIHVMHTPGHIDDAVCFYIAAEHSHNNVPKIITGDTLFVEGCGKTDYDNVVKLYDSIQRLKTLPDETDVYPGHDYGSKPQSTIGYEKEHNKFLLAPHFDEFRAIRLG